MSNIKYIYLYKMRTFYVNYNNKSCSFSVFIMRVYLFAIFASGNVHFLRKNKNSRGRKPNTEGKQRQQQKTYKYFTHKYCLHLTRTWNARNRKYNAIYGHNNCNNNAYKYKKKVQVKLQYFVTSLRNEQKTKVADMEYKRTALTSKWNIHP